MKCPRCGNKIKGKTCETCGFSLVATVSGMVPVTNKATVSYFAYEPKNPDVVYPVHVSDASHPNPMFNAAVAPLSKRAAKKAAKAAKKAAKAEKRAEKKAIKTAKAEKKALANKNWLSRLFAMGLIALCACVWAIFSFNVVLKGVTVGGKLVPDVRSGGLWLIISTAWRSDTKVFNLLPALFHGDKGTLYNVSVYVFALFTALALIHAIFANLNTDKAPKRVCRSLFFLGIGALLYSLSLALLLNGMVLTADNLAKLSIMDIGGYYLDTASFVLGGVCLFFSVLLCIYNHLQKKIKAQVM